MHRIAALLICLILALPAAGAVIRVPADQPTIQAGIDAAMDGDTVRVADGRYTGSGNRAILLTGKTIFVTSENGPEDCIIDTEESGQRAFLVRDVEGPGTIIEGFTITGGLFDYSGDCIDGGGIEVSNASPVIRENRLVGCVAETGAGIRCIDGSGPFIEDNYFTDNHATLGGGGISCGTSCSPVIRNNTIDDNTAGHLAWGSGAGGGVFCGGNTILYNNEISNNAALDSMWNPPSQGGGVYAFDEAIVSDNLVSGNDATYFGAGIYGNGSVLITANTIENNGPAVAVSLGFGSGSTDGAITRNIISNNGASGIEASGSILAANNLIVQNGFGGGAIGLGIMAYGDVSIQSCTIADNRDEGIWAAPGSTVTAVDLIIWGNRGGGANQIVLSASPTAPTELTISHSDLQAGQAGVQAGPDAMLNWGPGMINARPIFVSGPSSSYYLSHTAAGQAQDSPCVDTGSGLAADLCFPATTGTSCLDQLTTRSDLVTDQGTADMGFHFTAPASEPDTFFTGGPYDAIDSPVLNISWSGIDDTDPASDLLFSWRLDSDPWSEWSPTTWTTLSEYAIGFHYFEVRARDSDGNIDPTPALLSFTYEYWENTDDWHGLVTGPGPNPLNPPLVRTEIYEWLAFGVMKYGVNLAAGDIDNDGYDEIVTGAGPGDVFGPHVRCFAVHGSPQHGPGFLAYGTHKYGVNVACGDIDGDGTDEIVTGAGPGPVFGPHVRAWELVGQSDWQPIPEVSFFAYGTPKWGVNVACGDIDGDGIDEIITGAGPGAVYGAHVRGWNWDGGGAVTPIPGISYFAYGTPKWGVNVACGDIDADGRDEIVTGPGPGPAFGTHIRGWNFNGSTTTPVSGMNFFADPAALYGAAVACGDTDGDGRAEIVVTLGPSPSNLSTCRLYTYQSGSTTPIRIFQPYDAWMTHGARVAVGDFY